MAVESFGRGHDWETREVSLAGIKYQHRHCRRCWRDFATLADEIYWQAVYVGMFQFVFLDDEVTVRWIEQKCPENPLATDWIDRHTRPKLSAVSNGITKH